MVTSIRVIVIDPPEPVSNSRIGMIMSGMIPHYFGIHELSEILEVPETTIRTWIRRGKAPRYVRIGNTVRFSTADVLVWLAENSTDPDPKGAR